MKNYILLLLLCLAGCNNQKKDTANHQPSSASHELDSCTIQTRHNPSSRIPKILYWEDQMGSCRKYTPSPTDVPGIWSNPKYSKHLDGSKPLCWGTFQGRYGHTIHKVQRALWYPYDVPTTIICWDNGGAFGANVSIDTKSMVPGNYYGVQAFSTSRHKYCSIFKIVPLPAVGMNADYTLYLHK